MKLLCMLMVPFAAVLTMNVATASEHEEKVEIKSKSDNDGKEFKMKVKRKGDTYVGVSGEREYILRGEPATTIRTEGDYTVYGTPSADSKYFEIRRMEPVSTEKTYERKVEVKRD